MNMQVFLVNVIKTVPYLVLFVLPFKERLYHKAAHIICFGAACSVLFGSLNELFIHSFGPSVLAKLIFSILSILLMAFLVQWLIKISMFSFLFLILLCKNYIDIILLAGGELQVLFEKENAPLICAVLSLLLMTATLPLCYLLLKNFLSSVFDYSEHLSFWRYLWVLPGFYFTMYRLIIYPLTLRSAGGGDPAGDYLIPFWIASVLISYFILFRVMAELLENVKLKEQLHSAELLTQIQKEQYLALQNNIEEARRNRHDIKQQFIVIRGYMERGNYAMAEEYIEQCLELYTCYVEHFCRNYAVDSMIRYYVGMARSNQIETDVSVTLPENAEASDFPEVDFCTLLGNLLLNAVEAGIRKKGGRKTMVMRMAPAGSDMLALTVSNTYDGEVRIKDGGFYSSKRDSEGVGTVSVRQIVKKYQGVLKYTYDDGVFEASVLLRFPEKSEDGRP